MSLAVHVATLGRGPGRSRALTRAEASDAMAAMLSGKAAPEAIGALLMLLRMKGETAEEIAGLAEAAQAPLGALPAVALDWPSYAAGRTRGLPWFLLSARLVAAAGYPVLLHGRNGTSAAVRDHLGAAGIPAASTLADLSRALDRQGIAYAGLEHLHPGLSQLLNLRPVLGLRSCINTVCRMLNPARAAASVQGVFHPSYRPLQSEAAYIMGWSALSVIKGGGGEFECHPGKDIRCFGLREGRRFDHTRGASAATGIRRLSEVAPDVDLAGLWSGRVEDPFAREIVISTAALALETLGAAAPEARARALWETRQDQLAA
ncbi:MAG: glycosyl transferase family protein [Pseudomonadota bacterium]